MTEDPDDWKEELSDERLERTTGRRAVLKAGAVGGAMAIGAAGGARAQEYGDGDNSTDNSTDGGDGGDGAASLGAFSGTFVGTAAGAQIAPAQAALNFVTGLQDDLATGRAVQSEKYKSLETATKRNNLREDATLLASSEEQVLTSIENTIDGLERRAYQAGIEKAVARMNEGDSLADVKSKAASTVAAEVVPVEKNLLKHWSTQILKIKEMFRTVKNTSDISRDLIAPAGTTSGQIRNANGNGEAIVSDGDWAKTTIDESPAFGGSEPSSPIDVSLVDGSSFSVEAAVIRFAEDNDFGLIEADLYPWDSSVDSPYRNIVDDDDGTHSKVRIPPRDFLQGFALAPESTGQYETILDHRRYVLLRERIESIQQTAVSNVNVWLDGIYTKYRNGDLSLSEIVTADQLANTATKGDDLAQSNADLATLGVPVNEAGLPTVKMRAGPAQGETFTAGISIQNPPEGGFNVGDLIQPENIQGPVFLTYNRTDSDGNTVGSVRQATSAFEIVENTDIVETTTEEGETVIETEKSDTVKFVQGGPPKQYSTDIETLKEELKRLQETQQKIKREREALLNQEETPAGGGGGGGSGDLPEFLQGETAGVPNVIWAASGLGLLVLLGNQG